MVGSTLDTRWSVPVRIEAVVLRIGDEPVVLTGAAMTGQKVSLGRWATIDNGTGLRILLTERAAPTFDPESYRHVGLDPADAEAVVVRSATLYRAGWEGMYSHAVVLDLPGASTPQLSYLPFERVSRPLFPLDPHDAEYRWDTDE
jgi:microcystin degradation protein MlrC